MSFTVTKNGVGIMLGIYGDEFWRASGGTYYAFFSQKQIDESKSLHCRAKKTYDFLYSTWNDKVRDRVIHNLEYGILACNDPILKNLYARKPPPFVRDEFINRRGKVVEVSDVFKVRTYPKLDALRKELIYKYPDIEFRGIVVESVNFDEMCEKKMEHNNKQKIMNVKYGEMVKRIKEDFIRNRKDRVYESRKKIDSINTAARALETSQVWFQDESIMELCNKQTRMNVQDIRMNVQDIRMNVQNRSKNNILFKKNRFVSEYRID